MLPLHRAPTATDSLAEGFVCSFVSCLLLSPVPSVYPWFKRTSKYMFWDYDCALRSSLHFFYERTSCALLSCPVPCCPYCQCIPMSWLDMSLIRTWTGVAVLPATWATELLGEPLQDDSDRSRTRTRTRTRSCHCPCLYLFVCCLCIPYKSVI